MAEYYKPDEYSFPHYSDESINVGCVCSWSIDDLAQHRPFVDVQMEEVHFNSALLKMSDQRLYELADRLHQVGSGDALAKTAKGKRAVRASLRDYSQAFTWRAPRRFGTTFEPSPAPKYDPLLLF